MKKCCFIIPYYGKLPEQFPMFLKSCGRNPDFHWLLFTDDTTEYDYPENVRVIFGTLEEYRANADRKLGFHVRIDDYHKLCDLKPAYGFLAEELIGDYRFWGYCDVDTVMGCLGNFLTDELLDQYDKLFCLGHMTLIRNTPECNRLFMAEHNGRELYREVFTNPENHWFDEEYHDDNNINRIFLQNGMRVYQQDHSMNVSIGSRQFCRTEYVGQAGDAHGYRTEERPRGVFYWDSGRILRLSSEGGTVKQEEFLYMHLQYRKMKFSRKALEAETLRIVPDMFVPVTKLPESPLALALTPKYGYSPERVIRAIKAKLHLK